MQNRFIGALVFQRNYGMIILSRLIIDQISYNNVYRAVRSLRRWEGVGKGGGGGDVFLKTGIP